jgi:tetratricopeptide (TPR) repeat protein
MSTRYYLIVLSAVLLIGCAKDQGINRAEADRVQADRDAALPAKEPPISANTRFVAAVLAEDTNDLPNAIKQYQAALQADPKHVPSIFGLAVIYSRQRQFPKAIDLWNRYIAATNGNATGYSNLGFCYESAGRPADAESAYRQGIVKDPRNQACRVNYGLMLAHQGKTAEATEQLSAVLTPAEVHYDLASVYESQGKKTAARDEYREALTLDPSLSDAKTRLAAIE